MVNSPLDLEKSSPVLYLQERCTSIPKSKIQITGLVKGVFELLTVNIRYDRYRYELQDSSTITCRIGMIQIVLESRLLKQLARSANTQHC